MTRPFPIRHPTPLPAGAVVGLLALALVAPAGARAGCSHLVWSGADPGVRMASLIESVIGDPTRRSAGLPGPPPPRPCSGAWCSGQPAAPAVPAGMVDELADCWAWWTATSTSSSGRLSLFFAGTAALRPLHRGSAVFHPPRLIR